MSKFVVALDVGTREQRNAVTAMFQAKGWQMWHWMEDVWLLSRIPEDVTAKQISDEMEANPTIGVKSKLVMQIADGAPKTHWGRANKEAWVWMKEFWGKPG